MKLIISWLLTILFLSYIGFSFMRYAVSDIVGVWNKLPSHSQRIWNHKGFLTTFHNKLPELTDQELREYLRAKIRYEVALLQVIGDITKDLGSKNQLHGGIIEVNVDPNPEWIGDL